MIKTPSLCSVSMLGMALFTLVCSGNVFAQALPESDLWLLKIENNVLADSFTLQTARLKTKGTRLIADDSGQLHW